MFDWVSWFRSQLQTSAEGFVWAFSRVDPAYRLRLPPDADYLGTWSPARHVWHVAEYERCLALPSMQQWVGGAMPGEDAWADDDATWEAVGDRTFDALVEAFLRVRQEQIALLDQLAPIDWEAPRETIWGYKPLSMVVTKTYQHTFEHGNTLLRMGLWWADFERG